MVSVTVTSQVTFFPTLPWDEVMPSGLLPSSLERPVGSNTDGMFALPNTRRTMSLSW